MGPQEAPWAAASTIMNRFALSYHIYILEGCIACHNLQKTRVHCAHSTLMENEIHLYCTLGKANNDVRNARAILSINLVAVLYPVICIPSARIRNRRNHVHTMHPPTPYTEQIRSQ